MNKRTVNPRQQPKPWKPGQEHPERKPREWGGFSERLKKQQQEREKPGK